MFLSYCVDAREIVANVLGGGERGEEQVGRHTFSKSILLIAPSIPLTTPAILPVTCLIVTAVCTLLATASILDPNLNKLSFSFCFRIAFWA